MRKELANILTLFGVVLTAWGVSGWSSDSGTAAHLPGETAELVSGWPVAERIEIAIGALLLTGGVLLRGDSK